MDKKYHQLRKSLEGDQRFAFVRYLDPEKPTSVKKKFYSQAILKEFDKCYTVKKWEEPINDVQSVVGFSFLALVFIWYSKRK